MLNSTNLLIRTQNALLKFDKPAVMAIINATPDSFYAKSRVDSIEKIQFAINNAIEEGADIIDIGGMSSRPGADIITPEEEWNRIQPAIEYSRKHFPKTPISIDTVHSEIVELSATNYAVEFINDISSGSLDSKMFESVANSGAAYIAMHMKGTPETMQNQPEYNDVTKEVIQYFSFLIQEIQQAGIADCIIDPGFGFGKTVMHNYELLNNLEAFQMLNKPLLVGVSRKSMIYKPLLTEAAEALNGTTALHMAALERGASILRVHDVKAAKETITLHSLLHQD